MSDTNERFVKGSPLPASLGRCADLYKEVRDMRLAMEKETDAVHARENEIKEHLVSNLSKEDSGAAGLKYRAQRTETTKYVVKDWPALWGWIFANKRSDMMQKRVSDKAVADYVEAEDKLLPGMERFTAIDVSITKI